MTIWETHVSPNFKWKEFRCRCGRTECPQCRIDARLVAGLQELRERLGRPITITSGFRCPPHNAAVDGKPDSQHLEGRAADIRVAGMTPTELMRAAERVAVFARGGIGIYSWGVHVDVRTNGPARFSS